MKFLIYTFLLFSGYFAWDYASFYAGHGSRVGAFVYHHLPSVYNSKFTVDTPYGWQRIK